ncbi:hypothetical protein BB934_45205 (plasmid) [Microvirga ossetica]|uniref:Uncharacterized protein n=1 Tax=Microvirga ossetica TaxID=1882682 RepID=A0A1B2EZK4_9HYPH|nr:hypothetical protein [Microvirga ossetica]ANY85420.1 hypothetical protein BB934_45205 [Microvirga ossetica]
MSKGNHIRYIVRDVDTQGIDYLLYGHDDFNAAVYSLNEALGWGCKVELAAVWVASEDEPIDGTDEEEEDHDQAA